MYMNIFWQQIFQVYWGRKHQIMVGRNNHLCGVRVWNILKGNNSYLIEGTIVLGFIVKAS